MNRIHGRFEIANEDFLYVLSTMVFEPIRWNARFGWRPLIETERLATFYFWREVGRLMAIRDIPDDYDAFERFNVEFERDRFAYTDAGARVGAATRDMFLGWFPGLPLSVGRPLVHALLDEPLLDALGFPHPPRGAAPHRRGGHPRPVTGRQAAARRAASRACAPRSGIAATRSTGRSSSSARRPRIRCPKRRYAERRRPRSSADRAAAFEAACGGSIPPGATRRTPCKSVASCSHFRQLDLLSLGLHRVSRSGIPDTKDPYG